MWVGIFDHWLAIVAARQKTRRQAILRTASLFYKVTARMPRPYVGSRHVILGQILEPCSV